MKVSLRDHLWMCLEKGEFFSWSLAKGCSSFLHSQVFECIVLKSLESTLLFVLSLYLEHSLQASNQTVVHPSWLLFWLQQLFCSCSSRHQKRSFQDSPGLSRTLQDCVSSRFDFFLLLFQTLLRVSLGWLTLLCFLPHLPYPWALSPPASLHSSPWFQTNHPCAASCASLCEYPSSEQSSACVDWFNVWIKLHVWCLESHDCCSRPIGVVFLMLPSWPQRFSVELTIGPRCECVLVN